MTRSLCAPFSIAPSQEELLGEPVCSHATLGIVERFPSGITLGAARLGARAPRCGGASTTAMMWTATITTGQVPEGRRREQVHPRLVGVVDRIRRTKLCWPLRTSTRQNPDRSGGTAVITTPAHRAGTQVGHSDANHDQHETACTVHQSHVVEAAVVTCAGAACAGAACAGMLVS
jgi:hypothetical protein